MLDRLKAVLRARFGTAPALAEAPANAGVLADMANRRVMRRYLDKPVDPALVEALCAVALSAPTKSDLQQADIVIVSDRAQRDRLEALLPENPWVKSAPVFLVFPTNGLITTVKGFEIVVIGGLGSILGALIAGVLLGLIESFGAAFLDSAYQNIYGFALVLLVLVLKPTGLFGERGREA